MMSDNTWQIKGSVELDVSTFRVMGILNVTSDSFYDGNEHADLEKAVAHGLKMAEEGADIIDVGGESTRPGSYRVTAEEEIRKVIPVIKSLSEKVALPISCDTYKAGVAAKAIEAGASIINDISAFSMDEGLPEIVRDSGCGYVLMHMRGTPADMQVNPFYDDVSGEVEAFFEKKLGFMEKKGIDSGKAVIDPGIGFGKRLEDNLELIRHLDRLKKFGRPLLIGTSRKSFIGRLLNGLPAGERLEGSLSSAVLAYSRGARIFRVHDVKETIRALRVAESIEKRG